MEKIYKRYIKSAEAYLSEMKILKYLIIAFKKFGLNLTHENEMSKEKLVLLDIEIYIECFKMFHTKEHRKVTPSNSYIKFSFSHSSHRNSQSNLI